MPQHTHKADGLYYVDAAMLAANDACKHQLGRWRARFGKKQVPITLDVLLRMQSDGNRCVSWAAYMMSVAGRTISSEHINFVDAHWKAATEHAECVALMDLLAACAKREGRLT